MDPEYLDQIFEELGLAVGGLVHRHTVPDGFIWQLFEHLERIHGKARQAVSAGGRVQPSVDPHFRPHPAANRFLQRIRTSREAEEGE